MTEMELRPGGKRISARSRRWPEIGRSLRTCGMCFPILMEKRMQ